MLQVREGKVKKASSSLSSKSSSISKKDTFFEIPLQGTSSCGQERNNNKQLVKMDSAKTTSVRKLHGRIHMHSFQTKKNLIFELVRKNLIP